MAARSRSVENDAGAISFLIHWGFINPSRIGHILTTVAKQRLKENITALGLGGVGIGIAAAGIHLGEVDDAPGAALIGILLMIGSTVLAVKVARRKV